MGKLTSLGLLPPDHPMFSGGPEVFSRPGSRPSSTSSATSTDGATPAKSSSAPLDPNETYSPDHPRYAEAVAENPMLPAQNGMEEALHKAADRHMALNGLSTESERRITMDTLLDSIKAQIARLEKERPDSWSLTQLREQLRGYEAASAMGETAEEIYFSGNPVVPTQSSAPLDLMPPAVDDLEGVTQTSIEKTNPGMDMPDPDIGDDLPKPSRQ